MGLETTEDFGIEAFEVNCIHLHAGDRFKVIEDFESGEPPLPTSDGLKTTEGFKSGKPPLKEFAPITRGYLDLSPIVRQGGFELASIIPLRNNRLEFVLGTKQANLDWVQWANTQVGGCNRREREETIEHSLWDVYRCSQ